MSVGQACILRSVTIEDEVAIGDRCVLMEGSLVEKQSVLAPGTVLPPGRRVPSGELWAGNPAQHVRKLTKDEIAEIGVLANSYCSVIDQHEEEFLPDSFAYNSAEELRDGLKPGTALLDAADLGSADTPPPK